MTDKEEASSGSKVWSCMKRKRKLEEVIIIYFALSHTNDYAICNQVLEKCQVTKLVVGFLICSHIICCGQTDLA